MIVFCEDCGEKNHLAHQQIESGKAVFTCTSCQYANRYALKRNDLPGPLYTEETALFLKEMISFPDIVGAFIYDPKNGVLQNDMPGILKKNDLEILGKILTENLLGVLSLYEDTHMMTLFIANRNMVVKLVNSYSIIVIVCKTIKAVQHVSGPLSQFKYQDYLGTE